MEDIALFGTLVNVFTVILGSAVGLLIMKLTRGKGTGEHAGKVSDAVFRGLGLCVLLVGIGGAIKGAVNGQIIAAFDDGYSFDGIATENTLVIIISMVLGTVIGEIIDLDKWLGRLGDKIQNAMKGKGGDVAQGFVSASLLFCVGSMSIVGALNSGISGDHTMQITKAVLDLCSSVIFASTMGIGVMFSALFVLVYQGSITLLAEYIGAYLSTDVITCMTSVGSLLIIALGLNMIGVTKFKVMNHLPAIFLPIALIPFYNWIVSIISFI